MLQDNQELHNLILACLIGEGEHSRDGHILNAIYTQDKTLFLINFIKEYDLKDFVSIEPYKSKLTIKTVDLVLYKKAWYEGQNKIFSKRLDPDLLTLKSIILCAILFGNRRIEKISINTSVDSNYVRTLAIAMEQHLKVPVIPSKNQLKICDIPNFVIQHIDHLTMLENAELASFLTNQEKSKLVKVLN